MRKRPNHLSLVALLAAQLAIVGAGFAPVTHASRGCAARPTAKSAGCCAASKTCCCSRGGAKELCSCHRQSAPTPLPPAAPRDHDESLKSTLAIATLHYSVSPATEHCVRDGDTLAMWVAVAPSSQSMFCTWRI
jgi:hypothetical protein